MLRVLVLSLRGKVLVRAKMLHGLWMISSAKKNELMNTF